MNPVAELPRTYQTIDMEHALDWQKEALERIHIYDADGPKTVLYFSGDGARLNGHIAHDFTLPIHYFAPGNEEILKAKLEMLYDQGSAHCDIANAPDALKDFIESSRQHLEETRPTGHAYNLTAQEEVQISRIFIELNKYPQISSKIVTGSNALWLFTTDDTKTVKNFGAAYQDEEGVGGYYDPCDNTIIIGGDPHTGPFDSQLRMTVAEETIHALDFMDSISNRKIRASQHDIEEAKEQVKTMAFLMNKNRFLGMERANITFSPKEKHLMELQKRHFDNLEAYHERAKHPASTPERAKLLKIPQYRTISSLAAETMLQEQCAFFQEQELYQNIPLRNNQTEFFTKTLVVMALRRHFSKHVDPVAGKELEDEIFQTPYQKKLLSYLDDLTKHYEETHLSQAREQAEEMVEKLALQVERIKPYSTLYSLRDYGQVSHGMSV